MRTAQAGPSAVGFRDPLAAAHQYRDPHRSAEGRWKGTRGLLSPTQVLPFGNHPCLSMLPSCGVFDSEFSTDQPRGGDTLEASCPPRRFCPLNAIRPGAQDHVAVLNTLLSEAAALAFEFGYSLGSRVGVSERLTKLVEMIDRTRVLYVGFSGRGCACSYRIRFLPRRNTEHTWVLRLEVVTPKDGR